MPANQRLQTTIFGGLNINDQADVLAFRSHSQVQGGFQQSAPAEATDMTNIDFDKRGIKKRAGSTLEDDMSSLLGVGETIISAIEYYSTNGAKIIVRVGTASIYTNQSGSFVKVNNSASAAYAHNATVSKCTFAIVDGHLFIGLDGNNKIQVYRNGADLDPELENGNTYEDAFGAGTHTIDGTWGTGYYLLANLQGRLIYSDGNTVVNYSSIPIATDGVWKRSTHGFYQTSGFILALATFTPDYGDSIQQTLYIFTSSGPEITSDLTTQIQKIEGGPVPINHQSVVATKSWLIMLTVDRKIVGINRNVYIDLGRRFTDYSGNSDIETFDITNSISVAFGFYHKQKEQVYFFVPDSTLTTNATCFVIDLALGEPVVGQPAQAFEKSVRLSIWKINEPATNTWYSFLYKRQGAIVGILPTGEAYTFMNGKNDFATLLIDATYESLEFNAGVQSLNKYWITLNLRGQFIGDYTTTIKYLTDRATIVESTTTYSQSVDGALYGQFKYGEEKYNGIILVKGRDDIDLYSESIKFRLNNAVLDQTFRFDTIDVQYLMGTEEI